MIELLKKNSFFLISIGAVPSAIIRWQIDNILIVNIIGCFLLGFINSLPIAKRYKLIFGFGFCGSLTTFSGWSLKLVQLINQGFYKLFFFNSILIVIFGLFSVAIGHFLAKKIIN
ncbi:fluoride efflux transporter FluC [Prochlorococcus marinus]|uniref:Fluoride-specific ion channel FluC n=1 Tax=Prochlorococcus marinus XMU1408 TaxID=2213228 RepID=A0A318R245_PROMR|nr:CrcB family protein [Prochlorococcus marinus]MBW3042859.1 chromosome condensation protein CrcB [Prochlorococcus marinus str. XMU1408]PYE00685.1 chromosome condensation protein CrcB [Prochlorococcus marinus XMU1408]